MTRPLLLLALVAASFAAAHAAFGYRAVYQAGYGAFVLMAAMISLTFLWLWSRRATPLALGMAFSWAGASSVMGWWWIFDLLGRPAAMVESGTLFLALALYFSGAVLHFGVIERSLGRGPGLFPLPVLAALAVATLIHLAI